MDLRPEDLISLFTLPPFPA